MDLRKSYLSYNNFAVGPANSQYQLSISGFTGIIDDPFTTHNINGMKFTTKDKDNDEAGRNCAVDHNDADAGGWWYKGCSHIHINHQYSHSQSIYLNNKWHSLSFFKMKIKPYKCQHVNAISDDAE